MAFPVPFDAITNIGAFSLKDMGDADGTGLLVSIDHGKGSAFVKMNLGNDEFKEIKNDLPKAIKVSSTVKDFQKQLKKEMKRRGKMSDTLFVST